MTNILPNILLSLRSGLKLTEISIPHSVQDVLDSADGSSVVEEGGGCAGGGFSHPGDGFTRALGQRVPSGNKQEEL